PPVPPRGGDPVKMACKLARALTTRLLQPRARSNTGPRIPYATSERRCGVEDGQPRVREALVIQTSAYIHSLQHVHSCGAIAVRTGGLLARAPCMCICSRTCLPHHNPSGRLLARI